MPHGKKTVIRDRKIIARNLMMTRSLRVEKPTRFSSGFTLIEAMVVVALIAILAGLAAPNMAQFMRAREIESAARKIGAAAQFARSEAIKRNAPVLLCAGTDGACAAAPTATAWAAGWVICYDRDANGACDVGTAANPNPIRIETPKTSSVSFTGPTSRLQFNASGTMTGPTLATFNAKSSAGGMFQWNVRLAASGASSVRKESI